MPLFGIMDLVLDGERSATIIDFEIPARGGEFLEITNQIQLNSYGYAQCLNIDENAVYLEPVPETGSRNFLQARWWASAARANLEPPRERSRQK